MKVLGIETSCDETSAAVVEDGQCILSNKIATQLDLLSKYGGVVPEIAARRHVELIGYVIESALAEPGIGLKEIDAVAVTARQGLIGCLLVGVAAAKTLSYALGKPLIGLHHIEGHIFSGMLSNPQMGFPQICLTVSGGHTMLIYVKEPLDYKLIGTTLDDAAGEAFDKTAKFFNLGFPGGPVMDRLAASGNPKAIRFPRPLLRAGNFDFSFSGLKTSVINMFKESVAKGEPLPLADIAASFQEAIVDVLVTKTMDTAREYGVDTVSVTGGVSANSRLRAAMTEAGKRHGLAVNIPALSLCTDNAAMIAAAGYARLYCGETSPLDMDVVPNALLV
ncbi:tRNA (adenosine(37)-N6)-threonylcarbamoyltransferase complex transferase subunit TsaD [Chloroflexota bacterium]